MSKWIPKSPVKPLYVVHSNGNGYFKCCLLDADESSVARAGVKVIARDTIKTLRLGKPFVLFSGGRDSLCTLEYMRRLGKRAGVEITAVHADTTAGLPEVEEYVRTTCASMNVRLITVRPPRDFFRLAKSWGIPGVKSRWCCKTLKIAPIRRYLSQIKGPKVIYDGIRAAESPVRAKYVPVWFHPSFRCLSVSPIFNWSDGEVDGYIKSKDLPPNPTAGLGISGECWCGAYMCRSDFEALLNMRPDVFNKLVQVEKAQRGKYTFLYEDGKQVRLSTLKAKPS
jgi:3'-phosphoadenosine 5'-phosphosulfate sulfotransferase (PAPS reductase)/FAD synthetase